VSTFYVQQFGCRATQADGAQIEQELRAKGLRLAARSGQADLVILNTCTVTAAADQDVRASIRRISRENPACRILVTGCYAQRAPQEIAGLPGVEWVVGNSHKHLVSEIAASGLLGRPATQALREGDRPEHFVAEAARSHFVPLNSLTPSVPPRDQFAADVLVGDIFAHTELMAAPVFGALSDRTRPNLKVQDGCNNRCSFCIIPYVRGQSRSLPMQSVVVQVQALVKSGYREVVISGINLGRWGRDLRPQLRFPELVRAILNDTDLERLRISSVEPMDWSDDLIILMAASPRIAKHAHVPMQSGSDRILRAMHRKYRPWHYRQRLQKIRQAMPTAAIGADVMVGFPGETEAEFAQTQQMIEKLPFTYLHVFTYSSRPGTPSAEMKSQVPIRIARQRNQLLRDLAAAKKRHFQQSLLGQRIAAITLSEQRDGATECLTDNYQKLWLAGTHKQNQWLSVIATGLSGEYLLGAALSS